MANKGIRSALAALAAFGLMGDKPASAADKGSLKDPITCADGLPQEVVYDQGAGKLVTLPCDDMPEEVQNKRRVQGAGGVIVINRGDHTMVGGFVEGTVTHDIRKGERGTVRLYGTARGFVTGEDKTHSVAKSPSPDYLFETNTEASMAGGQLEGGLELANPSDTLRLRAGGFAELSRIDEAGKTCTIEKKSGANTGLCASANHDRTETDFGLALSGDAVLYREGNKEAGITVGGTISEDQETGRVGAFIRW
jgi:hypothetical protein